MLDFRIDLPAYLDRIGLGAAPELRALHAAHAASVPFENLDIQMGLPIRLDLPSLEAKLVRRRRGGYCFEQNTLFLQVLRLFGFDAMPCEARVRSGATQVLPRTHMVLVVRAEGGDRLCDVGFGADSPLEPVRMDGAEHRVGGRGYRVAEEGPLRVLQLHAADGWEDQYAFEPTPRYAVDFELANWYTSTHPESRFVTTLTAQRATPEARYVLRNLTLSIENARESVKREVPRSELVGLLRERFGLEVPHDARFRALDA